MTDQNAGAATPAPVDKFFLKSKTVWGIIIATAPGVLAAAGMEVPAELTALEQQVIDLLDNLNEIVGGAWALYGRYSAPGTRLVMR